MHLRRALLLFALVIGVAAVAASFSQPGDSRDPLAPPADTTPTQTEAQPETESDTTPSARPGDVPAPSDRPPETLAFDAAEDQTRRLETGTAASVEVGVDEPGLVSIPLLGLSGPAEPITPARFDVLVSRAGTYPVVFTPAAGDEEREVGTLAVTAPEQ